MTPAAERFVGPTTFAALSRRPVLTEQSADVFPHLEASRRGRCSICIAPAGANTIARLAHGEAPNVLTQSALAFTGPLLVAPAMNPRMWAGTGRRRRTCAPCWRAASRRSARSRARWPRASRASAAWPSRRRSPAASRHAWRRSAAWRGAAVLVTAGGHARAARRRPLSGQPLQRPDGRGRGRRGRPARGRRDADPGCGDRVAESRRCARCARRPPSELRAATLEQADGGRRDRDGGGRRRLPARPSRSTASGSRTPGPGRSSWSRRPTSWPSWAPGDARARC